MINADAALSIPDFRASERAFQLLVQVAGRAGRGDTPGRVLVQTYDPEHHAIKFAARHDVNGFIERELRDRKELAYPPSGVRPPWTASPGAARIGTRRIPPSCSSAIPA